MQTSLQNYNEYLKQYLSKTSNLPDYVMKNPIRALDSKACKNIKNKMSKADSIKNFLTKDQLKNLII